MAYKYCKSCGSKNDYIGSAPKFCSNCGAKFDAVAKRVVKNSIAQASAPRVLADDETDISSVPYIGKLQYEVSPFEKKSFKVEELFNLESNGEKEEGSS